MHSFARILIVVLAACATAAQGAPRPVRINLGTLAPRGSSYHQALQQLGEAWRGATDGSVKLVIYTDGTQGNEADMVRLMRVGTLQAGLLTVLGLSSIEPAVTGLQNMPLVFHDLDEFDHVLAIMRPELERRLRAHGFETLFWVDSGWIHFFSVTEAITPADFAKQKLLVVADPKQVEIMRAIGQNPVPLESNDIPAALQTGLITALSVPPIYALATQMDRKAGHMLRLNYAPLLGAAVVTSSTWEKIPKEKRETLLEAARVAGQTIRERSRKESNDAIAAMIARGLKVHEVTPGALAAWEKTISGVYPMIRGSMVPAEVFDEVMRHVKEYRAAKPGSQ
ncbi:MAG TPA: TRAP transporter substrate-binding protein DctP [Opitutaceae bacterium]